MNLPSSSGGFLWSSRQEHETSFSDTSDENTGTTDPHDALRLLKVSVQDKPFLILAFLNKIEKYVDIKSCPAELQEELEMSKLILANSADSFGCRTCKNKRKLSDMQNTKGKLTKSSIQKNTDYKNETSSKSADKTMEKEITIHSVTQVQPESPARRSIQLQNNITSKEIDSDEAKVENDKSKSRSQLKKGKSEGTNGFNQDMSKSKIESIKRKSKESDRRVSKRVKHNVNMDRLTYTTSKIKQVIEEINKRHNTELRKKGNKRQLRDMTGSKITQKGGAENFVCRTCKNKREVSDTRNTKENFTKSTDYKNETSSKLADKTMENKVKITSNIPVQPESPTRKSVRLQNNVTSAESKSRSQLKKRHSEGSRGFNENMSKSKIASMNRRSEKLDRRVKHNVSVDKLTYTTSKLKQLTEKIKKQHNTELTKKGNKRQMRNIPNSNITQRRETSKSDANLTENGSNIILKKISRASSRTKN